MMMINLLELSTKKVGYALVHTKKVGYMYVR